MEPRYHRQITTEALQEFFNPDSLETVIRANLQQDSLRGQIGHPEYHFDDNAFQAGQAYIESQRVIILESAAVPGQECAAQQAFGRLTHAAQDFYAHSNYVRLWAEKSGHGPGNLFSPEAIYPLDAEILLSERLRSGRIYHPWEALVYIPIIGSLVRRLLPHDAHAWLNLDSPQQGPLFACAFVAARKRTQTEFERVVGALAPPERSRFTGA